jgi:hypothetical protein
MNTTPWYIVPASIAFLRALILIALIVVGAW